MPPSASQWWAKVWRSMCGCRPTMPASLPRLRIIWPMPLSVIAAAAVGTKPQCRQRRRADAGSVRRRYRSSAWAVLAPNGQARGRRPLPSHDRHVVVEVDVVDPQLGQLVEAHAGVEEQADRLRCRGARTKPVPAHAFSNARPRPHRAPAPGARARPAAASWPSGWRASSPSSRHQAKNCCSARKRTLAVDGRARLDLVGDEVLDVTRSTASAALDAGPVDEIDELTCGFAVGLDRLWGQVAGPEGPPPGVDQETLDLGRHDGESYPFIGRCSRNT